MNKKKRNEKLSRHSPSSSVTTASVGKPLAARLATSPSLVEGTYAPPVNTAPHFPQFQTPTLRRRTEAEPHLGHS
jgi:hypothetical protein